MRYLDSRVSYKPKYRYVTPSIITHLEIPSEDSIHELGKQYPSIQITHFSGIGKEVRPFGDLGAHSGEIRWRCVGIDMPYTVPTFLLSCIALMPLNMSLRR